MSYFFGFVGVSIRNQDFKMAALAQHVRQKAGMVCCELEQDLVCDRIRLQKFLDRHQLHLFILQMIMSS